MPRLVDRSEWKPKDHYVSRVFQALDEYARRERKGEHAGYLHEAKIRELLGLDDRGQWPRVAEFKRGERGVSPDMLRALCEKGNISLDFLVLGQSCIDRDQAAMERLEQVWSQCCQDFIRATRESLRVFDQHRHIWMWKCLPLLDAWFGSLERDGEAIPLLKQVRHEIMERFMAQWIIRDLIDHIADADLTKPIYAYMSNPMEDLRKLICQAADKIRGVTPEEEASKEASAPLLPLRGGKATPKKSQRRTKKKTGKPRRKR